MVSLFSQSTTNASPLVIWTLRRTECEPAASHQYHALERLTKVQRTRGISRRQFNSQSRGVHGTATFQQHDVLAVASSANTAGNVIIATLPFRTHLDHKSRAHAKLSRALVQVERRASAFKLDASGVSRVHVDLDATLVLRKWIAVSFSGRWRDGRRESVYLGFYHLSLDSVSFPEGHRHKF